MILCWLFFVVVVVRLEEEKVDKELKGLDKGKK